MSYGIRTLGKNLREQYEGSIRSQGPDAGHKVFKKSLSDLRKKHGGMGKFDKHISLRALAEGILGENWEAQLRLGYTMCQSGMPLMESSSIAAIDASAFSNITGQLLIDRIRDNYDAPAFIGDKLMEIQPVTNGNLGQHREPWLSRVKDDPGLLNGNQPYPFTTFVEQFIDLPPVERRGEIVAITLEMVASDKTKQAMNRCDDVGFRTRFQREERQLRCVAGLDTAHNFKYMNTTYSTYVTTPGALFTNAITGNQILNYQGLTQMELLFSNMVDFVTGKAIMVDPAGMMILTVPYKVPELKIALHAAQSRSGQYPNAGAPTNVLADYEGVPLINDVDYPMVKSAILWHLLTDAAPAGAGLTYAQAKEYVFLGHFEKAFVYREQMPFTTTQAPPGNPAEFYQDIAVQVKAMEWGVVGVQGPQQIVRSTNT